MVFQYAVTIKCNEAGRYTYREDFKDITDEIFPSDNVFIDEQRFELDSHHVLHSHMLITTKYKLCYKNHMCKGWHIYIRMISGALQRWVDYIRKEKHLSYDQLIAIRAERWAKEANLFLEYE